MKKVTIILAALIIIAVMGLAAHAAFFSNATVVWNGKAVSSKKFDFFINQVTNNAQVGFDTYSGKAIVYAQVGNGPAKIKLASYSSTAKATSQVTITKPYRYVFVEYTSNPTGSAAATPGHSCNIDVFSW